MLTVLSLPEGADPARETLLHVSTAKYEREFLDRAVRLYRDRLVTRSLDADERGRTLTGVRDHPLDRQANHDVNERSRRSPAA